MPNVVCYLKLTASAAAAALEAGSSQPVAGAQSGAGGMGAGASPPAGAGAGGLLGSLGLGGLISSFLGAMQQPGVGGAAPTGFG